MCLGGRVVNYGAYCQPIGCRFDYRPPRFSSDLWHVPLLFKQYNLVPASAGKLTPGLASHCGHAAPILVVFLSTGSRVQKREIK